MISRILISMKATTILAGLIAVSVLAESPKHYDKSRYQTAEDKRLVKEMETREADWRNGAIVYQVIVDRFAPSRRLREKADLYQAPRTLKKWTELPKPGKPLDGVGSWSHELEFWGGDLDSLAARLNYLEDLGVDVLYLNPIFEAFTNHKYDTSDYRRVSAEYGTRKDVSNLAAQLHARGMRLVLDGVFNHMGWRSSFFQDAKQRADSPYRDWFFIDNTYQKGHRSWIDSGSLPELRLENPAVQDFLFRGENAIIRSYLRDGIDGWRLDVAFDIGPEALTALTQAAHSEKPDALVVGEIWSYPDGRFPAVDGTMNFTARKIIEKLVTKEISGPTAATMIETMVQDSGMDHLLKSWLLLDNHDTKRLKTMFPDALQRSMAQMLQFTLPGSPNLYYGAELGMIGGDDPANRGPMRWDLVTANNPDLVRTKALIAARRDLRALRIGNFRRLISEKLLAFERYTDKALETVFVLANPTNKQVTDTVLIRNWKMMNGSPVIDVFTGKRRGEIRSALLEISLEAQETVILKPIDFDQEWSPYERIH